jgi:hypothetical protein
MTKEKILKMTKYNVERSIARAKKMGWTKKIEGKPFYFIDVVQTSGQPNKKKLADFRELGYYVRLTYDSFGRQLVFARKK